MLISVISVHSERGSSLATGRGTALSGEKIWFMTHAQNVWNGMKDWDWEGPLILDIPTVDVFTEVHTHTTGREAE